MIGPSFGRGRTGRGPGITPGAPVFSLLVSRVQVCPTVYTCGMADTKRPRMIRLDPHSETEVQSLATDLGISFSAAARILIRAGLAAQREPGDQGKGNLS